MRHETRTREWAGGQKEGWWVEVVVTRWTDRLPIDRKDHVKTFIKTDLNTTMTSKHHSMLTRK